MRSRTCCPMVKRMNTRNVHSALSHRFLLRFTRKHCRSSQSMTSIVIKLSSRTLPNPDLDLRYVIPDLLKERSAGIIRDDGYDYGSNDSSNLYLFLTTDNLDKAVACITEVVDHETVLDNRLADHVVVAIREGESFKVVYPASYNGTFAIE